MSAIFLDFYTPLPHVGSFLILSIGNFDQFLTPLNCRRRLWTAPKADYSNLNLMFSVLMFVLFLEKL